MQMTAKERAMQRFTGEARRKRPSPKKGEGDSAPDQRPIPLPPPPDKVEAYYDTLKGGFYFKNAAGEFQRVGTDLLALELRAQGFFKSYQHENGLSYLEAEVLRLIKERSVHYAGPLGGFNPGRYDLVGTRVLVTSGPSFIDPKEGKWDYLRQFLTELLRDQARYFCAWMRWALDSIRRGLPWSPGQMLAIAGPRNCGKSFLQCLVTPMLGGRVSKPYQYLTSTTSFNAEIFGAEHALIGDEVPNIDMRARRNFGSALKNLVANKEQMIHPKGKTPVTLTPFLRVSMSLNDNAESLLVLPPLDSDVSDKIILLRATPVKFPWPSKRFPDSQSYYRQLEGELPAFLYYLRRWRIPETIQDQRYGVVSFKDASLVEKVDELSPEHNLWEMVERYVFSSGFGGEWTGTAADLVHVILEKAPREKAKFLSGSAQAGQYLSRLQAKFPGRVESEKRGKNKTFWTLRSE